MKIKDIIAEQNNLDSAIGSYLGRDVAHTIARSVPRSAGSLYTHAMPSQNSQTTSNRNLTPANSRVLRGVPVGTVFKGSDHTWLKTEQGWVISDNSSFKGKMANEQQAAAIEQALIKGKG
jgi:hypothetical protein